MRWLAPLALALVLDVASATLNINSFRPSSSRPTTPRVAPEQLLLRRQQQPSTAQAAPRFLTPQTQKFAVNGSGLPNVDFDVGESYAGSLPISRDANDTNQLFFWFFPSENQTMGKEITIWLTGGPGCSSIGELMSSNGPFLWPTGVFKPIKNQWSWHRLTNMVWIDQPIGSGYSQGTVTARNEHDVAQQFMGFWKNFIDTFAMQGYKVYVTGSSYSGMYCPYIASAMLDANDTQYFDVKGMQVWDGVFANNPVQEDIPVAKFVSTWSDVFGFNDSFTSSLQNRSRACGYDDYLQKHLTFPAAGRQPAALPGLEPDQVTYTDGCALWNDVLAAASETNPCFSLYTITQLCPLKYDPLGFSDGLYYTPAGSGPVYFDRPDVKAALHAPQDKPWEFCLSSGAVFVNNTDASLVDGPGSQPVIPGVIDRTHNVILGHGTQDFVLIADGTLLAIQNMTWGGQMGFQSPPADPLYVPYHGGNDDFGTNVAGAGVLGTAHSERGLTYITVGPAGHFLTIDAPAVAFRSLEILLGHTSGFQSTTPFITDTNNTAQPSTAMGNGTVLIGNGGQIDRGAVAMLQDGGVRAEVQAKTSRASMVHGRSILLMGMVFVPAFLWYY